MPELIEKELKEIARLIAGLERHSEENDPALDPQIEKISEIFRDFNKKYAKLTLKLEKTIDTIFVRIFINEDSVKRVFDDATSKLKGLTGIGLKSFDETTIQEADKFASTVNNISNSVLLTYSLDTGTETIVLELNEKEKKVELNFEIKSIANPFTPQFQLLKEYALKDSNQEIDFLNKCYELGFIDIEDAALFEWEDEFYPKMLE